MVENDMLIAGGLAACCLAIPILFFLGVSTITVGILKKLIGIVALGAVAVFVAYEIGRRGGS